MVFLVTNQLCGLILAALTWVLTMYSETHSRFARAASKAFPVPQLSSRVVYHGRLFKNEYDINESAVMRIAGKEFAKAQPFAVRHRPTRTNYAHTEVSVPVNKSPDVLEALGKSSVRRRGMHMRDIASVLVLPPNTEPTYSISSRITVTGPSRPEGSRGEPAL
jgi:hypothetical protein